MKRAQNFLNVWNPDVTMPGGPDFVKGMMQVSSFAIVSQRDLILTSPKPRFANGTWNQTDPRHCSIHDPEKATCFLNAARRDGFYEASPIVYSQVSMPARLFSRQLTMEFRVAKYVPQDTAQLIELQGGPEAFIQRLDWIFENVSGRFVVIFCQWFALG
jgi:putative alpha-1,2-mannosidase